MEQDSKFKKLIAPDIEARREIRKTLTDYAYYIIIFLISLLDINVILLLLSFVPVKSSFIIWYNLIKEERLWNIKN